MEKQTEHELLTEEIEEMKGFLDAMLVELKKYPFSESHHYLKPLKNVTYEALSDLLTHRWKRVSDGKDLLNDFLADQ